MSVLGPTAEFLSFARPKERNQRKGRPACRLNPALLAFVEGFSKGHPSPCEKRAASLPRPCGQFLAKCCDARGGMRGFKTLPSAIIRFAFFLFLPGICNPDLKVCTGLKVSNRFVWVE
jgi:hypothetical protein